MCIFYNLILFIRYHYEDDRQHFNTTKLAIISIRYYAQGHGYVFDWPYTQGKLLLLLIDTRDWDITAFSCISITYFYSTYFRLNISSKFVHVFLNYYFHVELRSIKFWAVIKTNKSLDGLVSSSLLVNIILYNTICKNDKIVQENEGAVY